MTPTLEERLRRVDPTVDLMVDAVVEDREDVKKEFLDWAGADSLAGLSNRPPPEEVGVRLSTTLAANLTNTVQDGNMTDLDGPPSMDAASPFFTAQVKWGGTEPRSFSLQRITAWLDPDTGGGKNVEAWIAQLFGVYSVAFPGQDALDLIPLMDPVRVTAGGSAAEVVFDLQGMGVKPKQLGTPLGGSALGYPDPTTILFIWAVKSDGTPATNVGWGRDSAQTDKTTADNELTGMKLTKDDLTEPDLAERYLDDGNTGGLPYVTFEWSSYTTATISFTAAGAGNNIDLGAAPSNGVQFILRGFTPGGTSFKAEVNDGSGWVEVRDGDFADTDNTPTGGLDLSVTGTRVLKQQTYDIRCQLITNATSDDTPKLTQLGVAEVTITDFANLTTVGGGVWEIDPVSLKGFVTQIEIAAIRDGVNDYRDKITTLLAENNIGAIRFRLWWGAHDLDRNKWFFVDAFNVRDYDPSGAAIVITGVSALAQLKAVLPVVTATPDTQPLIKTNVTLEAAYDDIIDGQLGLAGKYRGPGIEDNTTTVSNEITDSDVKVQLDALTRLARGSLIPSQGRVKYVQMFDDGGAAVVVFPREELGDVQVLPGFRERRPEFFVPWDYQFGEKRYKEEVREVNAASLSALGLDGLSGPPFLEDAVSRWIDTQALAEQVGQDTNRALATGLMLWVFTSTMRYPELEPGDRVTVPTERFVAKDPLAARALRGHLWAIGRIVQASVDARQFAVWIQGYTDIFTTKTVVNVTKFADPKIVSFAIQIDADTGISRPVIQATDALSVRVASSTSAFPSLATTQAAATQALDSDGNLVGATLATMTANQSLFVTALVYEGAAGLGAESRQLYKAQVRRRKLERTFPFVDDKFALRSNTNDGATIPGDTDVAGALFVVDTSAVKVGTVATPSSLTKTVRLAHPNLTANRHDTAHQVFGGSMRPATVAVSTQFYGTFQIPPGVTITKITVHHYREDTGDAASAQLFRVTDNGTTFSLASVTHSTTGWQTQSVTISEVVDATEMFTVLVTLNTTGAVSHARHGYSEIEYTMPSYDKGL